MDQGMPAPDDYKNYVQLFNRGTMLKPRRYQLTAIHHQATVHKKTLVIMADCCRSAIPELNVRQRLFKKNISGRWASQLVNLAGAQIRVCHCLRSIGTPQ
jgi:hypothetical protein